MALYLILYNVGHPCAADTHLTEASLEQTKGSKVPMVIAILFALVIVGTLLGYYFFKNYKQSSYNSMS